MASRITIKGFEEAQRKLLALGREAWLRDALKAGGEEVEAGVRSYAPGSIKQLIATRLVRNPKIAIAFAGVDMKLSTKPADKHGKRVRYPYLVEYGVRAHAIKAEDKGLKLGGGRFAQVVNHPGFPGVRYFARGLRSSRGRAKNRIESMLVEAIERLETRSGA